jgi:hypothetical protein
MDRSLARKIEQELHAEPCIGPALESLALVLDVHGAELRGMAELLREAAEVMTDQQRSQRRRGMWA